MPVNLYRADDPAWEESLGDIRRDVFHTASYHAYEQGSGQGEPYLVVVGDGRRGMAWPYLLRRVADLPGLADSDATDVNSVYGYPGPLAWGTLPGDRFIARAWPAVVDVWRAQGAIAAFSRFHPLLDNASLLSGLSWPQDGTEGDGSVVAIGPTVSVDCTLGDDEARAQYDRALRQHIAAGRRAGLVTIHDEDWSDLSAFADLYRETMARNGAAEYYFFDRLDFERLRAALSDHVHLLVTKLGDEVGAAGLFTEFGGIVQAHLVGTNSALRSLSPFKILLDDARSWARERGNTVIHLGGGRGGREDTLLSFKGEFSPRRHLFHVGRWVLDRDAYQGLLEARLTEVPSGRTLDPGFFPAYRAPLLAEAERSETRNSPGA
ncbi:MAG: GNAT family N-acetyltransferase [Candidatus Limnocylindrales bacterium]|jgi:hypothetical protein